MAIYDDLVNSMGDPLANGGSQAFAGSNELQGVVNQLSSVVNNLNNNISQLVTAVGQMSANSGGMKNSPTSIGANGGNVYANCYGANAGGPSFSGSQNSGNGGGGGWFANNMANGNGGWNTASKIGLGMGLGSQVLGMGINAATGYTSFSSYLSGSSALLQARQMNTFGSSAALNYSGLPGIAGSNNVMDYANMAATASALGQGPVSGGGNFSRWMTGAAQSSYLNPMLSGAQGAQIMSGFGNMSTNNLLTMYGLSSYSGGKQLSPAQITANLLSRMGASGEGASKQQINFTANSQNSMFNAELNSMIQTGAITSEQAVAMRAAAGNILTGESQGMTAQQAISTLNKAASGNKQAQATEKSMGFGNSLEQQTRSATANQTNAINDNLGSFNSQISGLNKALSSATINLKAWNAELSLITAKTKVASGVGGAITKAPGILNSGPGMMGSGAAIGALLGIEGGPIGMAAGGLMGAAAGGLFGLLTGKGGPNDLGPQDPFGGNSGGGDASTSSSSSSSPLGYDEAASITGASASGGISSWGMAAGAGNTNSAPVSGGGGAYGTSPGIAVGKVSPAQAIAKIRAMMASGTNLGVGYCQHWARTVYGIGGGAGTAAQAWAQAKYKHSMSEAPPVGAFIFWTGGSAGDGHVAIYAGGGKVYSPGGPGDLSHWVLCSINTINTQWGLNLVGWTEDNNGVRVVKPATSSGESVTKSSASGASASAIQRIVKTAASKYGWSTGANWQDISNIVQRESDWNPTAQNPGSSAYGLFQFLNSTWQSVGAQKTSDPAAQAKAGMEYIKERYGTPVGAWKHEQSKGWYERGTMDVQGDQDARLHNHEMVLTRRISDIVRGYNTNSYAYGNSGGGVSINFGKDAIQLHVHGSTAATGTALANEFVDTLAKNERLKKLMAGDR